MVNLKVVLVPNPKTPDRQYGPFPLKTQADNMTPLERDINALFGKDCIDRLWIVNGKELERLYSKYQVENLKDGDTVGVTWIEDLIGHKF